MKQEDKELLLRDLSARLPYNVVISCEDSDTKYKCFLTTDILNEILHNYQYYNYKPYLRPMSSMTGEERKELSHYENPVQRTDFYYSHHIDCRFMIEKNLAIKAPEEMYK